MKRIAVPVLFLIAFALASLQLVPAHVGLAQTSGTPSAQEGTEPPAPGETPALGETPQAEPPPPTEEGLLEGIVGPTRTPRPTLSPGRIEENVARLAQRAGFYRAELLGLRATDWINLAISLLFVLAGYLLGTVLIRRVLPPLAKRTASEFDDRLLAAVGAGLRWLIVIWALDYATQRLVFVSVEAKSVLRDAYVVAAMTLLVSMGWKLVGLADAWYRERSKEAGREDELAPVITLLTRVGRILVVIIGVTLLLSYFGVYVTAVFAALGLGGLAFSLAARDTIADAIAGFIVLVDRPFRIGDRIEIQNVGTWGDVIDIGLRTTRIRTRDNRLVIVPNSIIGSSQVVNYSYPDPRYRIQTHVGIAYGTDNDLVEKIIVDAVRQVDGVLPDRPVDALYIEMGESAMIYRVRWWIESYVDTRRMFHRVHKALQRALDDAGIESPFPTQSLDLQVEPETAERIAQAFRPATHDSASEQTGKVQRHQRDR